MEAENVVEYLLKNYEGIVRGKEWGETALFYNPGKALARGTYFVFIKENDTKNDIVSDLNRKGVYRINMGVSKETFLSMFEKLPEKPQKGEIVKMGYDFQEFDKIMPHLSYGWAGWICILNPSKVTFEKKLKPLIDEAYVRAKSRFEKRTKSK